MRKGRLASHLKFFQSGLKEEEWFPLWMSCNIPAWDGSPLRAAYQSHGGQLGRDQQSGPIPALQPGAGQLKQHQGSPTRHWALPWQQGQVKARLSACGWAWLSRIHGMAGQGCGELEPIPAGSGTVAPGQGETARVNLLSWRHPKALWTQSRKLIGALRTLTISLLLCHHNVPYKSVGLAIFIKTKKRVQMRGLALKVEIHIPQQSSDTFEEGEGTALGLLRTPENNPKSPKMTSTPASTPHPHSLYSRNTVWTLMSSCISSFLLQSHS